MSSLVFPRTRRKDFWEFFFQEKYWSSPIPKRGLQIMLEVELKIEDKKRKILERFQDIIESNYQNNENTGDYQSMTWQC